MTDKINNISTPINGANIHTPNKGANASASNSSSTNAASSTKASADQVDISATQSLDKIRESLASEPVVDRQKVESVKQALQDGTYQINSENIATKLIEFEQLLK